MRFEKENRIDVIPCHCPNYECIHNRKGRCYDTDGHPRTILKMTECEHHEPKEEEQ